AAARAPRRTADRVAAAARAVSDAVDAGLRVSPATQLNRPIGPHRRVEWLALELAQVKDVKNRLGGTVNDVVLATVAGALHRFLGGRGELRARLDYRIVIPVNLRPPGDTSARGNSVSARFLSLPIADASPLRRHRSIRSATERTKEARAAEGIQLLTRLADGAVAAMPLLRFGGSLISWLRPYNLIVTNVPGPQMPLFMLGARLHELLPMLPLFDAQGLGVAALSYCGRLGVGLIADRELAPDLATLREAFEASFEELCDAARSRRHTAA
ncbi:MAG: wax ester/triacylglycerol synthase family O-acyltransferase, partial [Proteobacteria bacterium]